MRVLQVIQSLSPLIGGGSMEVVCQMSKALTQAGHEVVIYCSDFKLDQEYIDSLVGVKVCPFYNIRLGRPGNEICFTPGMIHKLEKEVQTFDIVHINEYISFPNTVACHYAKKYGIPYVLQAHGGIPRIMGRKWVNQMFDMLFGYRMLKGASKVIAVSSVEAEDYRQIGVDQSKIVMIPNGLDIEFFNNLPPLGQFKERNNIRDKRLVLFLGRIDKGKGLGFLVESFVELTKEVEDAVLILAGPDAGYEKELRALIKTKNCHDRIRFTGYIGGQEKLSAYVDADVLVYPSIIEVFGLVPFEAIMCSTPAIVTDGCGCSEWIKKSGAGYLVTYGDVNGLKERMIKCLMDDAEAKRIVEQGRDYIRSNLSWATVVDKLETLYNDILLS